MADDDAGGRRGHRSSRRLLVLRAAGSRDGSVRYAYTTDTGT